MGELLFFIIKYVAGAFVAVLVTLSFSEAIKERLAPFVTRFGSKTEKGIQGKWLATFEFGSPPAQYAEVIEIYSLVGVLVGRIVPDERNHAGAASVAEDKPVRVRGSLKDHSFFTGVWLHPSRQSHEIGAFQLIVAKKHDTMSGGWLGYSEHKHEIESGRWTWQRLSS